MRLLALSLFLTLTLATSATAKHGDCGQPRSDGDKPTVGDVLHILGAVLHQRECPEAMCDVDDDCRVTLRDALQTLQYVVGKEGSPRCSSDCPGSDKRCGETEAPTCGGVCPEDHECRVVERDLNVRVCHIPPGNPDAKHTIWISQSAVRAHLEHGDYLGRCRRDRDDCWLFGDREDCRDDDDDDCLLFGEDGKCHDDDDDDDCLLFGEDGKCRDDDDDDDDGHGSDGDDLAFTPDANTWWWPREPRDECRCKPRDDGSTTTTSTSTTTSTTNTTNSSTTTTTTTTTLPGNDTDNDGLPNVDDPCPTEPRNLCVGAVAVDGVTGDDIRLNAGVSGAMACGAKVDCNGDTWNADFGYNQAASATSCTDGGCPISNVSAIFGCTDEPTQDLFRCEHWDAAAAPELEYSFDVPDGTYVVNLFFANTFPGTSTVGSRTIDIIVEGEVAYAAFDQIAAAGGLTQAAVVRSAMVAVEDGNGLQLSLGHVVENPSIKAIEVLVVEAP